MSDQLPPEVTNALAALAEIVYSRPDYEAVYAAICQVAVDVIPGCDHATLSVLTAGGGMVGHGATSPVAALIDELEDQLRSGPCYDAIVSDAFQMDADLTDNSTWPELGKRVLELTPVRGMLGYRVLVGPKKAGALNVFSDTAGALDESSARVGALIASFASVALGAAAQHQVASTLREGLLSNREIGKAIGILMAAHDISDDEAFGILRRASQDLNVKLGQIARRVVDEQMKMPGAGGDSQPH